MITDSLTANIHEIFSSIQGEGTLIGSWQIFIRFRGCSLRCVNCDTPDSWDLTNDPLKIHKAYDPEDISFEINPVSVDRLDRFIKNIDQPQTFHKYVVLTGGEPLEQTDFLQYWLPEISKRYRIMLETNAVHPEHAEKILEYVHFVSMDYKLPSFTGGSSWDKQHLEFYKTARNIPGYIKIVVTPQTNDDEIQKATEIVAMSKTDKSVILQPTREYRRNLDRTFPDSAAISPLERLNTRANREDFQDRPNAAIMKRLQHYSLILMKRVPDVRIIPQMHPDWRIP